MQSDFTRSDQSASYLGEESCSNELSYTSLKMARDKGAKRQKRTDSMELGGLLDFDRSLELEKDALDGTYDNNTAELEMPRQSDVMRRQLSIDNLNHRLDHGGDIDNCFLERHPSENQRGSMLFFGLAVVFGAVAAVGTLDSTQMVDSGLVSDNIIGSTGKMLKSASDATRVAGYE